MIELTNYISKVFYKDNNLFCILTYIDVDEFWSNEKIVSFMQEIVDKNAILKQTIIEKDNLLFLDKVKSFDLNDYYTIEYVARDNFDTYISSLLNTDFDTESKWKFLWCVDKETKKTRFYFKIHHAYADGYKVIDILTSTEKTKCDITGKFKRTSEINIFNKLYEFIIGTLLLVFMNMLIFFNVILKKNTECNRDKKLKTDYIICKALPLDQIKTFTKNQKLTINDFLYALMIKADKLYNKQDRIVTTCTPFNISRTKYTNNASCILNNISNSDANMSLLKNVNTTFNHLKKSLYIPISNFIINTFSTYSFISYSSLIITNIIQPIVHKYLNKIDYTFSNIIGPTIKEYKLTDIHFLTIPVKEEIIYNIISSGNNVNIVCNFKEGIIADKAQFEKYIYEAYASLLCV